MIVWLFPKVIKERIQDCHPIHKLINTLSIFFTICLVYTFLIWKFEEYSFVEAIWQTWQAATTVGYGNAPPVTISGRIVTLLMITIAIGMMGLCISNILDLKSILRERKLKGMAANHFKDGYIIINYPGISLMDFIKEILIVEKEATFCLIDNTLDEIPDAFLNMKHVRFVKGSVLNDETYLRANVRESRVIIVFPDRSARSTDADGQTAITVGCLLNYIERTSVHLKYVLCDSANERFFKEYKSRAVAIQSNLNILALVQDCHDFGSAKAIQQLLKNSEGANPQNVKPTKLVGMTWGNFITKAVLVQMKLKLRINFLGVIVDENPDTCPDVDFKFESNTQLLIIAYDGFNWDDFQNELLHI